MGAILLKCKKCGRVYSIEKMDEKDGHQCICGEMLDKWSNYIGFCENANMPNKPRGVWKRNSPKKSELFPIIGGHRPSCHRDYDFEYPLQPPKEKCQALAMVDELGKVKAIPIFYKDTQVLVFRATALMRREDMEGLGKEYSDKIGIKCVVVNCKTELVAVQNG